MHQYALIARVMTVKLIAGLKADTSQVDFISSITLPTCNGTLIQQNVVSISLTGRWSWNRPPKIEQGAATRMFLADIVSFASLYILKSLKLGSHCVQNIPEKAETVSNLIAT